MKKWLTGRLFWCIGVLFLALFIGMQMGTTVYAAPANTSPQKRYQADGTMITISTHGDEYFNWVEDENGKLIAYDEQTNNWCYAYVDNNELLPGSEVVGTKNKQRSASTRITRNDIVNIIDNRTECNPFCTYNINSDIEAAALSSSSNTESRASAFPQTNQELLLLLIEFSDVSMKNSGQYWYNQYFGVGKSVSTYYKDMSGGQNIFIPSATQNIGLASPVTSTVNYSGTDPYIDYISWVSWVSAGADVTISNAYNGVIKVKFNMPHPIPEYGGGYPAFVQHTLVTFAMKAVKENTTYNFDGLGINKQVAAIVAGAERSGTDGSDLGGEVWAHSFYFDGSVVDVPNNQFPYMMHGEMCSDTESTPIGVACHELGHILGLPDLYNTTTGLGGIGYYSLMANGLWGCTGDELAGTTPVALDAWSKYMLGYVTPIEYETRIYDIREVKSAGTISDANHDKYNALKLNDTAKDTKQYFLIENRQNEGWDAGMQFHFGENFYGGILILQIDENIPLDNYINGSDSHRGVDIVGAPNNGPAYQDCFYAKNKSRNSLTSTSTPDNSMFYSTSSSDPLLNMRDVPTNITIHVKSNCANVMQVEVGIDGDITNEFTDTNFLAEVRTALGKNNDDSISKAEVLTITSLDVSDKSIHNLNGIEYFRKLKDLVCYFNFLTSLDASGNTDLETIDCSYNENLESLNVSKNTRLKNLDSNYCALSSLDVSHCGKLELLNFCDCYVTEMDLSHNPLLETYFGWGNRLTELDVTNNTNLTFLDCSLNYMTSPDDVIGWRNLGLTLGDTFVFYPQDAPQQE